MTSFPVEILPKLPVKSLLRFKSISKQHNSLISSPNFATLHLTNALASDANRLLIIKNGGPHLIDFENPNNPPLPLPLPASFTPHSTIPVAGSCNGLLLLRPSYRDEHLLINPFTRLYSSLILPMFASGLGFGFDSYLDEYKIVAINRAAGGILVYNVTNGLCHAVYNNNKDGIHSIVDDAIVFNGHLFHWLIWCPLKKKYRIMCFDICIENWTLDVPLPNYDPSSSRKKSFAELLFESAKDKRNELIKLRVFEGCLSLLAESPVDRTHSSIDLWVMKEYGVVESWVKLFKVPRLEYAPLGYARGNVLFHPGQNSNGGQLIWYDIRKKQSKKA